MKRFCFFVALVVFCVGRLSAHALWIDTRPVGKTGQVHPVRVFFGEYSEGKPVKTAKWFSDLGQFKLYLIGPDGKKNLLSARADSDFYATAFTPSVAGVYRVVVVHDVAAVYNDSKLQYNCIATVLVGDQSSVPGIVGLANELVLSRSDARRPATGNIALKIQYRGKPVPRAQVSVTNPANEETHVYSNENGEIGIQADKAGKYMVQVFHEVQATGDHNGKPYKALWYVANELIEVQ